MATRKHTEPAPSPRSTRAFANPLRGQTPQLPAEPAYRAPAELPRKLGRPPKQAAQDSSTTAHPEGSVSVHVEQQECYDAILLYTEALDRIGVEVQAAAQRGDQGRVDALLTRARRLESVRDRFGVALARAASPR